MNSRAVPLDKYRRPSCRQRFSQESQTWRDGFEPDRNLISRCQMNTTSLAKDLRRITDSWNGVDSSKYLTCQRSSSYNLETSQVETRPTSFISKILPGAMSLFIDVLSGRLASRCPHRRKKILAIGNEHVNPKVPVGREAQPEQAAGHRFSTREGLKTLCGLGQFRRIHHALR